jgi:mannose-1-phosphate guanylyltransferase
LVSAVILAGGFGTRLRPLTADIPKPLVTMAGIPLIRRIIDSIPPEVDSTYIAAGYRSDDLRKYFSGAGELHTAIEVVTEEKPLGTAGALWNLRNRLGDEFLVFNGDVVNSLSVEEMLSFHRSRRSKATISLWEVEEPEQFGIVRLGKDGAIAEFVEKPRREEAFSRLINAGTYVMDSSIFDSMDANSFSLEREVFPGLAGAGLYGYEFKGYWVDCGSLHSYLAAQKILLAIEGRGIQKGAKVDGCAIVRPVAVERGAAVRGSRTGPNVYIESGVRISEGCTIEDSVIMKGAEIGMECKISGSIVGPSVRLPDRAESHNQILVRSSL